MADTLHRSKECPEHKHMVLGLVSLKVISDAFEVCQASELAEWRKEAAKDWYEYLAENIFWVQREARWARLPTIGQALDRILAAIERDNPALKEVLPKDCALSALDKKRLGQLIYMIVNIRSGEA